MSLSATYMSPLEKCLFSSSAHFSTELFVWKSGIQLSLFILLMREVEMFHQDCWLVTVRAGTVPSRGASHNTQPEQC